ncbi:MAG TPA: aminoglycoside phosphotransferase family protein [Candidatus Limnocylindria bacterium]|nr:aminoglycoside phosphotransferase family protein [Candidatus Limnocylindria bacterium]
MTAESQIERLERIADEVARDWGLTLRPGRRGRHSYVGFTSDGRVLKVTPVEDDEADHEADALALWNGDGAVRLLRRDDARRALLIERARPGTDISVLPEDEANAAAVGVAFRLWKPARRADPFRSIAERVELDLGRRAGSHELVSLARTVFEATSFAETTLLHGDYHHYNVLRSGDGYVAIDPKPLVGEPEFDVPPFLWNPIGQLPPTAERTERRIAAFAAAGLDPERIRRWAIVRGVCLGLPLGEGETEDASPQLRTVRQLL